MPAEPAPLSPCAHPGSMAYMMITTGDGVAGFTLDPTLGALGGVRRGRTHVGWLASLSFSAHLSPAPHRRVSCLPRSKHPRAVDTSLPTALPAAQASL